jgi:hypothetical protein
MRAIGGSSLIPSAAFSFAARALGLGIGVALSPKDAESRRDCKCDGFGARDAEESEHTSDGCSDIGGTSRLASEWNPHHVRAIRSRRDCTSCRAGQEQCCDEHRQ